LWLIFHPMKATTLLLRTAGSPAHKLHLSRVLSVAVMTALLAGAPMLVRSAVAQRPASIQASAFVTTSMIAVALRTDSAVAAQAMTHPFTQRLSISGVGALDVQAGPGEVVRVAPMVVDARNQTTLVVEVLNVGS